MEGYTIQIMGKSEQEIHKIESLRKQAFHLKASTPDRYASAIKRDKIIPFALFKGEELIGGCYVGDNFDSLYIYYLFLNESYQKSGLKLGRRLLTEILAHKQEIEALLEKPLTCSKLHPNSEPVRKVYEEIGYQNANNGVMIKRI